MVWGRLPIFDEIGSSSFAISGHSCAVSGTGAVLVASERRYYKETFWRDKWRAEWRESLDSEKWQSRRRQVLARRPFCEQCHVKPSNHVHHLHGKFHRAGWVHPADYPDHALQALCRECHIEKHPCWRREEKERLEWQAWKAKIEWFKEMRWPL